ncbi:MAG: prepilin-type N-terminal cleavage/methylation domain-containing protein [Rickettsiales bacterium]
MFRIQNRAGFTLLELSVVLVVLAPLQAAIATAGAKKIEQNKYEITAQHGCHQ